MITRGFTFILGMIDWNIDKTKIEKKRKESEAQQKQ